MKSERSEVTLSRGSEGLVTSPSVHDARIVVIDVEDRHTARIGLIDERGSRFNLYLEGLRKLRADGFAEGNVVLEIEVSPFREADSVQLPALYFSDGNDPSEFKEETSRALREGWRLVRVDESYGCSLVALCERVTFSE